jgi:hypothetical protein
MSNGLVFSHLIDDYGNAESPKKDTQKERITGLAAKGNDPLQYKPNSAEDVLMQLEERNVGAVSWEIYKKYLYFGGGFIWAPVILVLLILAQGSQGWFLSGYSLTLNIDIKPVQLSRRCFLGSGREIPYKASNKAVTWLYTLRLVRTPLS